MLLNGGVYAAPGAAGSVCWDVYGPTMVVASGMSPTERRCGMQLSPGWYLPGSTFQAAPCRPGYYCPGSAFATASFVDQGLGERSRGLVSALVFCIYCGFI